MHVRSITRASTARLVLVAGLAAVLIGLPPLLPSGDGGFEVTEKLVPLAFADAGEGDGFWVSQAIGGGPTVAGLTWDDGPAPEEAWMRSRGSEGWSAWTHIELDDEHAPDPTAPEGSGPENASAPVIVTGASEIQFRVEAETSPNAMQASVVRVDGEMRSQSVRGSAADAAPSRPSMVMRSQWGGDDCLRDAGKTSNPQYVKNVQVMFVHHTAGTNSYTRSESSRIVRGICDYHVRVRGWADIGYNFLVDKYGTIYEGRGGGVARGVQGAHTGGFNSYSTGVSFMGNHGDVAPSWAARTALRRLGTWKLYLHNVDPLGHSYLKSLGSSKYSSGTTVRMANISGHRDASSTSCPGGACYNLLGYFRHAIPFVDDNGSRFERDITWIAYEDVTMGCNPPTNDRYCPDDSVLRKQMAAFLVRANNLTKTSSAGNFTDVPAGSKFARDINKLATAGITKGCNPPANDRFCPDESVSREQMAAFLVRAEDLTRTSGKTFKDVPPNSTFAEDIDRLATAGVTKGCTSNNDYFCPKDDVTRAQMAAFLRRAMSK